MYSFTSFAKSEVFIVVPLAPMMSLNQAETSITVILEKQQGGVDYYIIQCSQCPSQQMVI